MILRLLRLGSIETASGCWLWQGARRGGQAGNEYGLIKWRGRQYYVHRLALSVKLAKQHKAIGGLYACHLCPHKLCCNPEHVTGGTQSKNMRQWHRSRYAHKPHDIPERILR